MHDKRFNEKGLQYSLWLSSDLGGEMAGAFDDDQNLYLGGSPLKGDLIVYVNDSPVRTRWKGSSFFPIYDFLEPGTNLVRIEGNHPERVFVKVIAVDPKTCLNTFKIDEILAKAWFEPTQDTVSLEFTLNLAEGPDYSEISSDDVTQREIRGLIAHWADCCKRRDSDAWLKSMMPDLKSPPPYMANRADVRRKGPVLVDGINNGNLQLVTEFDNMKIIIGKRSAIAYCGVNHESAPYLFEFRAEGEGKTIFFAAPTLIRMEGKWRIR